MSKIHKNHKRYRERLLTILADLLRDPGPYSITEMANRFQITPRKLRDDIQYLIEKLNVVNQREYIIRERGYYKGNFPRAVANLSPQVRLYLFLALKQIDPVLEGEGKKAFDEFLRHVYSILAEEDVKRLKEWADFYHISQFGYPIQRSHFYKSLSEVFEAVRYCQIIKFRKDDQKRYLDPFCVYYAKQTFYIVGQYLSLPDEYPLKIEIRHTRLDRMNNIERLNRHYSQLDRKPAEIRDYKKRRSSEYIKRMLEAEFNGERETYVINIFEQDVFRRIVEKEWHPYQSTTPSPQPGVVGQIRIPNIASWHEMKKWILGWGSSVELIEPQEKRLEIRDEIRRLFLDRYK